MSSAQSVAISLATYKAIEAQRLSFNESHDAIIRRALAERTVRRISTANRIAQLGKGQPRKRGNIRVRLFGKVQDVINLRDAYLIILAALVRRKSSLFQLMAAEGSARRRWIGPSAEALFLTAPHLSVQHAYEIAPRWFVDTNVSRAQIMGRLTVAARLADVKFGEDVAILEA